MQPYDGSPPPSPQPPAPDEGERDLWRQRPGSDSKDGTDGPAKPGGQQGKAKAARNEGEWERTVLEKLAFASLKEQRARRRWRIFFTLIFLGYIGFITWTVLNNTVLRAPTASSHTAMVRIHGVIAEDREASARYVVRSLRDAFEAPNAQAVVLNINSPGGSPVQAGILRDEILRLKAKHDKPVYAVIGDVGASAAYYIAVAADQIYVDKASLVGSIGVLLNGFGFTGTMDKLGVERRLISAGESKGFMDPFSPQNPGDVAHAQRMLRQIHDQFITVVREGRGERLQEKPDMFSGLVWTGEESITLGLADGYGSIYSVARDVAKAETLIDYTRRRGLSDQVANVLGSSLGSGIGQGAMQELQGDSVSWR